MDLSKLKLVSVVLFFCIARNNNDHVILPMILVLATFVLYVFIEFKEALIPCLSALGLILVLTSLVRKSTTLVIIGYALSYSILIAFYLDESLYKNIAKELYFIITSGLYVLLSFIVIIKSFKTHTHQ